MKRNEKWILVGIAVALVIANVVLWTNVYETLTSQPVREPVAASTWKHLTAQGWWI
jgi:hypothetical protein